MKKKLRFTSLPIYCTAVAWSLVTLYPLYFTLVSSFKDNSEIFYTMFALPKVFHFEYYVFALTKANILLCISNSIYISSLTTIMTVLITSMAAFAITKLKFRLNNLVMSLFVIGLLIPMHSTLIPIFKFVYAIKGQNNFLMLVVLYTALGIPFYVLIIHGYMKGISREIDEAATIDGCGSFRLYAQIIFPLSMPILSTAAILSFLSTYNELIFSVMFISDRKKYTVTRGMMSFVGERSVDMGPILASIILSIIPMVIIYLLFQEKVEKGLTAGAIKG